MRDPAFEMEAANDGSQDRRDRTQDAPQVVSVQAILDCRASDKIPLVR